MKKTFIGLFFILYLFFCQFCVTMRTSERKTKLFFKDSNVVFTDSTFIEGKNKIHYIITGNQDKPTLFFVHGSPGSWDAFKKYLTDSSLLNKFRMIAIDRPGFGFSNFRKAENLASQSKNISAFIKTINNNQPIILVGHSLGGPVITKLAIDDTSRYSHIVILAGAIDPNVEKKEKWRLILKFRPIFYLVPGALAPSNEELWWLKKDLILLKPELKKVKTHVSVIHGTNDPLVPFSNTSFIEKEFINAKSLKILPIKNANHFIPWEHFNTIRDYLLTIE